MLLRAIITRLEEFGLDYFYPYEGPQKEYLTATEFIRLLYGSNSTGKTYILCAEACMQVTGQYPSWYPEENRYDEPIDVWIGIWKYEKFWETHAKYIRQFIGPMIADEKKGVHNYVEAETGKQIKAMSYKAGSDAFESSNVKSIHLDEEPDTSIVNASRARLVRQDQGRLQACVTPLKGAKWIGDIIASAKENDDYFAVQATLDDNKSLNEEQKRKFRQGIENDREYKIRCKGQYVPAEGEAVFDLEILEAMEEDCEEGETWKVEWQDDHHSLEKAG